MNPTAQKWDQKYQNLLKNNPKIPSPALQTALNPAWVLQHHADQLPLKGKGLDLACGLGGNALFMAKCGLKVEAWDISEIALTHLNNLAAAQKLPIQVQITNLDQMLLPYQQFDVIVISHYLNRRLFPQIQQALKPNGRLYYQTFLAPVQKQAPQNPNYYLQSGELPQAFPQLTTQIYGEGTLTTPNSSHRYAWWLGKKPNSTP